MVYPKVVVHVQMVKFFAGTRVILEFIPNHTSNESDWFVKSVARDPCCEDFYVWRDASGFNESTGQPIPPNNWVRKLLGKLKTTYPIMICV